MVSFKDAQFPKKVTLHAVLYYVRYAVSNRDLKEILAERGVVVDHATQNRWDLKYASELAAVAQQSAENLYRTVDRHDQTLDFMLSERRDEAATLRLMAKAITSNGLPKSCAIDTSEATTAGLAGMNAALRRVGSDSRIRVYQSKYCSAP